MITPEEFKTKMEEFARESENGEEMAHIHADELMCEVLKQNGYEDGAELFENMPKWYS